MSTRSFATVSPISTPRVPFVVLALLAGSGLVACGAPSEEGATETLTVEGEWGRVTCSATPERALAQGMNEFSLLISERESGVAIEEAAIEVTTWMPSMSHYTEGEIVVPLGGGSYHVGSVSLVMGGDWEIRYGVTGGAVGDTCVFTYEVP